MVDGIRKQKRLRDETLICERCGVSFLWTVEEQHQGSNIPSKPSAYCPGCQLLMPDATRERGIVKWYNPRKQYGFIVRQKAAEIFIHRSQLSEANRLQEGDLVEFSVVEGEKGLMAADVHLLQRI
ncbi:MAG: cold shock domain-containing protein [Caldilineaceae bacterium]|nr:cold shock domain-containing protein [Caldilineaceae bacterium]